MGITIETPEDFLDQYKDPACFAIAMRQIREKAYLKPFVAMPKALKKEPIFKTIGKAQDFILKLSEGRPCWDSEIEANASLNAQFILMSIGMGYGEKEKLEKLFRFVLEKKDQNGLYPLYFGGPPHYSSNLLIYLAGRALGLSSDAPELKKIREYLLEGDITQNINMETKLLLAVYGLIPWECVPNLSPLLILLPQDADFSIYSISYWVRTSLVPMSILYGKKYAFPSFPLHPDELLGLHREKKAFPPFQAHNKMWDMFLRKLESNFSVGGEALESLAIKKCERWVLQHQDESGDWGGIYPAMQYSLLGLYALGYTLDHPVFKKGMEALVRFHRETPSTLHQQPCVSPVWDTAWSLIALERSGMDVSGEKFAPYRQWLLSEQILQEGDWAIRNKTGLGGAWAFQYYNAWYPDTDDTAVVIMSLLKHTRPDSRLLNALQSSIRWLLTMQNPDGGWSAFEQGVDDEYVNAIPFNDMDNWQDPSTADVTGRCIQMLGELGMDKNFAPVRKAVRFLQKEQEKEGSWFGRWGVNYIYGTWSVVMGLSHFLEETSLELSKSAAWLESVQNPDGGWGESCDSYEKRRYLPLGQSTASQTAWAMLSLIHSGKAKAESVKKGATFLMKSQRKDGGWDEEHFTGTGFPRHFYLHYDYYRHYFPLWALGEYLRRQAP